MRICARCGSEHTRNHSYCRACVLAYNRMWRERNPGYSKRQRRPGMSQRGELVAYRAANPEKNRAHYLVYHAVHRGKLDRPEKCPQCGKGKPQAHHEDYAKPLDVIWLCQRCHSRVHAGLLEIEGAA